MCLPIVFYLGVGNLSSLTTIITGMLFYGSALGIVSIINGYWGFRQRYSFWRVVVGNFLGICGGIFGLILATLTLDTLLNNLILDWMYWVMYISVVLLVFGSFSVTIGQMCMRFPNFNLQR